MSPSSLLLSICLLALYAGGAPAQDCPECYDPNRFAPFDGHGASSDGRRIIKVCFDSTAEVDDSLNPTPGHTNTTFWNDARSSASAPAASSRSANEVTVRLDRVEAIERKLQFSLAEPEPERRRKRRG